MIRLLSSSCLLVVLAVTTAAGQDKEGLEGGPALPSQTQRSRAPKAPETPSEKKAFLAKAAAGVADYLTRAFVADAGIAAEGWLSWGKPSDKGMKLDHSRRLHITITTARAEVEVDDRYERADGEVDASRRHKLAFKDLIGKTIVEVGFAGAKERRSDGLRTSHTNDAHALGHRFNENTILRFEMTLKKDEAAGQYRNAWRAVLKTNPFKKDEEKGAKEADEDTQPETTYVTIGVERAYNTRGFGDGESNALLGGELSRGYHLGGGVRIQFKTTIEVSAGARDEPAVAGNEPTTLGATGKVEAELSGKTWNLKASAHSRANYTGLGSGSGHFANRGSVDLGIKLEGEWRFSDQRHKLYTTLQSSYVKTVQYGTRHERAWRTEAEAGIELNKRWTLGVIGSYERFSDRNDWMVGFSVGFKLGE